VIVIKYLDGTVEVEKTDKLEIKVSTLIEQKVETIFVAKNQSDINAFIDISERE
jgi:hypothetical protein